jgi:hypothetical protein
VSQKNPAWTFVSCIYLIFFFLPLTFLLPSSFFRSHLYFFLVLSSSLSLCLFSPRTLYSFQTSSLVYSCPPLDTSLCFRPLALYSASFVHYRYKVQVSYPTVPDFFVAAALDTYRMMQSKRVFLAFWCLVV